MNLLAMGLATAGLATPLGALAQEASGKLGEVEVSGSATPVLRTEKVTVGPLGEKSLIDTPYAVDVVPADLITNQQLRSVREAFRFLPSVQGENIRPQTRGLQAGVVQNVRIDGMNIAATTDYPLEQFDRIEVLNGLAGALYGPANPAGTFNFVLKRPTDYTLRRVTLGYATHRDGLLGVDLGGTFGEEQRFGYRVNLVGEGGEQFVDSSSLRRRFASVAFDARLSADTKLETNISRYHFTSKGLPGTFALGNNVVFPAAPDPEKVGYGQPFGGDDNVTDTLSGRIKHRLAPGWTLVAGLLQQSSDRASTVPTNTLTNNSGAYTVTTATTTFTLDRILSNTVALNGRVVAGGMTHDLVLSNTGFDWDRYQPFRTGAITLGTSNLANPTTFNAPAFPDFKDRYKSLSTQQQSLTVGDTVGFNEQWALGVFLSHSWIKVRGYNSTGASVPTSAYDDNGLSTNATLSYKPQPNATAYVSFADSLQQGDIAPSTAGNRGTPLAPFRSQQWELGYKMAVDKLNLTAALFHIERPYAATDATNIFRTVGEQVNKGLELTASGALTPDLGIFSGLTYLDPKVFTPSAATSGKQILGLSRVVSSVLLDYRIAALPGFFVSARLNHATSRPGNNANTFSVDGYTTVDLGARYSTRLMGNAANFNVSINNAANERYWANITPSGQNGYSGAGNGQGTLGTPRTVRATAQFDF
ncbi:MAG: TonB-dependent receptor [Pseudomonadota bacterium]